MKKLKIYTAIALLGLALGACEYDFVAPEEVPDITEDVSFSETIAPIFESQCAGCHQTGGQSPDLSAANAFQSINNSKYIDVDNPEESLIYSFAAPGASTHSWKQFTVSQAEYLKVWIEQGAQNN